MALRSVRSLRWNTWVFCSLALVACSRSESEPDIDSAPVEGSVAPTLPSVSTVVSGDAPADGDLPPAVRIDVRSGATEAELSGLLAESTDPFGQFVSCSGLRAAYGTYSVVASATSGDVRSISVVSAAPVDRPGIYDASIRVEFESVPAADADGTITIEEDGRSGSFVGFDADDESVAGTFACEGGVGVAQPLEVGTDDGVLEAVEVFALLRSGDSQRIVGLAAGTDVAGTVECAGASGAAGDPVVSVDGDESLGAITMFELSGGPSPTIRLRVGDVTYEFDDVVVGGAEPSTAGTFSAAADGVTVDGAFRCT